MKMKKQYGGPCLPAPGNCIDLSLPSDRRYRFYEEHSRNERQSIADYRHLVRRKMFSQELGRFTPWGVWVATEYPGLYHLQEGSLDNCLLDAELTRAFFSDADETGDGVHFELSRKARSMCRASARKHLQEMIAKSTGNQIAALKEEILHIPIVDHKHFSRLSDFHSSAERELAYAVNSTMLPNSRLMNWLGGAQWKADNMRMSLGSRIIERGGCKVPLNLFNIIAAGLPQWSDIYQDQWFFIDLKTLALLSGNFVLDYPAVEKAWLFWSCLAGLAGLPSAVITQAGGLDPKHPLSPCNATFDPIFVTLVGMWALGACSDYEVHLSMNHPVRGLRGAYIRFALHGDQREKLLSEGNDDATLTHPSPDPKPRITAKDIFEQALNASKAT